MKRLQIEVPATSANLGPGFDTIALALDITNTVSVELDPESEDVVLCEIGGEVRFSADPHDNLLCRAYRAWGQDSARDLPGARFTIESRIPIERGLGSSAACIVAGLAAAAFATEDKDARERMLRLAAGLEGHADNVTAGILGGVTAAFQDGETVHALHVANHLALGIALFIPSNPLQTTKARAALPAEVPMEHAVFNLGRVAYLTTALVWGRWDRIGPAMQDRLHQPYRGRILPGLDRVIGSAIEAGAYGASLSGGGPSIIALGRKEEAARFASAMKDCARELDWEGESRVTGVRAEGVSVKEVKPEESPAEEQPGSGSATV